MIGHNGHDWTRLRNSDRVTVSNMIINELSVLDMMDMILFILLRTRTHTYTHNTSHTCTHVTVYMFWLFFLSIVSKSIVLLKALVFMLLTLFKMVNHRT